MNNEEQIIDSIATMTSNLFQTLVLAAKGCSDAEICKMENTSYPNIRKKLTEIFKKTGLDNRVKLAYFYGKHENAIIELRKQAWAFGTKETQEGKP